MHLGLVKLGMEAAGARADVDNLDKEVMDALKGHAYKDDCQVWELLVQVPYRQLGKGGGICKRKETPGAIVGVELLKLRRLRQG